MTATWEQVGPGALTQQDGPEGPHRESVPPQRPVPGPRGLPVTWLTLETQEESGAAASLLIHTQRS